MAGEFVKVDGVQEFARALQQLGKSAGKAALRRVGKKAMEPVAAEARRMAPVDDGDLRDSIVVSTALTKGARGVSGNVAQSDGSFRAASKSGVSIYVGTANRNGVPREFGSIRSPAQPFMRPAWAKEQSKIAARIGAELGPEIEKTAARAARKKARIPCVPARHCGQDECCSRASAR